MIRSVGGVDMSIKPGTTYLSGAKDGKRNKRCCGGLSEKLRGYSGVYNFQRLEFLQVNNVHRR